jgi:hypothetical protein
VSARGSLTTRRHGEGAALVAFAAITAATVATLSTAACGADRPSTSVVPVFIGDQRCSACSIVVAEIGVIGNDSLRPTLDAKVAADGDSLIAMAPLQGRQAVGLFDRTGSPQRQLALPDGWRTISALLFADDGSLALLSEQRTRIVRMSAEGALRSEVAVPPNTHRFLPAGNRTVVNAEVRTPDAVGLPLHVVSSSGSVTTSFGNADPTVLPREGYQWRRRLAPSQRGHVWSANPDSYSLELWDTRGRLLRQLVRKSPWWDSASTGADPGLFASEKPRAELIAIWEDSSGLLWTQVKVAAGDWSALSMDEIAGRRAAPFRLAQYDEFFETVIEVIEPDGGTVLATLRFPGAVGLLLRGNLFAKWQQTGAESYSLRLLRLSLEGYRPAVRPP